MRLIISNPAGDVWGRLEPETAEEIVVLDESAARGEWTIARGTKAITELRALATRLGYPVRVTETLGPPRPPPPRLVVVQRGETALAEQLRGIVVPSVPVIWDRRERDRRTAYRPDSIDRRGPQSATLGTLRFLVLRAPGQTP